MVTLLAKIVKAVYKALLPKLFVLYSKSTSSKKNEKKCKYVKSLKASKMISEFARTSKKIKVLASLNIIGINLLEYKRYHDENPYVILSIIGCRDEETAIEAI